MGGTFGKSGSWVVDHSMDGIPLTNMKRGSVRHGSIVTGFEDPPPPYDAATAATLETPEEKKGRKRSHWIAYATMFVMSIGFSIVLTGVWPYLHYLNRDLEKDSIGMAVAANPLGQMLAAPIFGILGNKLGTIRGLCISSVFFFILGNVMYSLLSVFDGLGSMATYYAMIVARFIVGVSSANVTLCRSYIAQSTTVQERTIGIAIIAASQALGFVVGPGIQTLLIVIFPNEVDTGVDWLKWNKYTSAGWVAAALGLINIILFLPCIFQEYNIAEKERALFKDRDHDLKLPKPDFIALVGLLFGGFCTLFIYVLMETLAVPFVQDQYAWTDDKAMLVVGVALMGGGFLCSGLFPLSGVLARKIDERKVMLIIGYVPMLIGTILYLPFVGDSIVMQVCYDNTTQTTLETTTLLSGPAPTTSNSIPLNYSQLAPFFRQWVPYSSGDENDKENCTTGCPVVQEWCHNVPQLPTQQLAVAFVVVMLGYPIAQSVNQGIYSKALGPKPQGLWMGILTSVGSFARVTGPLFVSYVYTEFGTYWCFGSLVTALTLAFIELWILYPRLVPMQIPYPETKHGFDGPAAEKY